jgi:hypothetical protein
MLIILVSTALVGFAGVSAKKYTSQDGVLHQKNNLMVKLEQKATEQPQNDYLIREEQQGQESVEQNLKAELGSLTERNYDEGGDADNVVYGIIIKNAGDNYEIDSMYIRGKDSEGHIYRPWMYGTPQSRKVEVGVPRNSSLDAMVGFYIPKGLEITEVYFAKRPM